MQGQLDLAEPRRKANLLFGLAQLTKFEQEPNKFVSALVLEKPPGAPIGMPGLEFLYDDQAY